MNKSTVLHLPPKASVPMTFLQEALTKFPTVLGFALRHEGKLVCESHPKHWEAKDLGELLEATKDDHRVVHFGNWPKAPLEGDVPPYVLLNSENDNVLAIFPEGDFSGFAGLDGEHADEYCMASESLFPRIEKALKDADNDQEKFFEFVASDKMKVFLRNTYKYRGYFLFYPVVGDPIIHDQDSQMGATYSFGTVSNSSEFTYKEASSEPEKAAEPVSILDRIRGLGKSATATASAPAAAAPPPPKEEKTVIHKQTKSEVPAADTSLSLVEMRPPASLKEGGVRNHWFRLFNAKSPGDLPKNHDLPNTSIWVHPSMVPFAQRNIESGRQMKQLTDEVKQFHANGGQVKDFKTPKETKSTTREKFVPSAPAKTEGSTLSFLSDKEKLLGVEVVSKYLDVKSKERITPLEMQKLEANWGQFSDEIGSDFHDLLFVPPEGLMELFGGNKPAVSAFIQMRRRWIQDTGFKLEDLISTKVEETKVDTSVSASPSAAKSDAPAASSNSGFSFLRKSAA